MPAAPASSKSRTVRSTFSASPKPVSASQRSGSDVARVSVRGVVDEFGDGEQANVRQRVGGRQRRTRQVHGLEAEALGYAGDQRVEDAGHLDRPGGPGVAQPSAGGYSSQFAHRRSPLARSRCSFGRRRLRWDQAATPDPSRGFSMSNRHTRPRRGCALLWVILVLFASFAGLSVCVWYASCCAFRRRPEPDRGAEDGRIPRRAGRRCRPRLAAVARATARRCCRRRRVADEVASRGAACRVGEGHI